MVLRLYRSRTTKDTCTEIDLYMYRSRHVPKVSTPLYRNCRTVSDLTPLVNASAYRRNIGHIAYVDMVQVS